MGSHRPSSEAFGELARGFRCAPVYRELSADGLTPVSAYVRIEGTGPSFLFESVVGGERVGRYSFLGSDPFLTFEAREGRVKVTSRREVGGVAPRTGEWESADPFRDLEALTSQYRSATIRGLPSFLGGAVGYAAYDAARYTERLPNPPADDRGLPDLAFHFYDRVVVFDHIRKTVLVTALAFPGDSGDAESARSDAARRVDELVERLSAPRGDFGVFDVDAEGTGDRAVESNMTKARFLEVVERCLEYIRAGDVFQVVPSQRFRTRTTASPFGIYRALRIVNPAPFLFYLNHGEARLIGSSPEIMTRVIDGEITSRPLAGTRRRGETEEADRALEAELLADPKERAEHIMLIDLARNDVGRVSERASVRLGSVMRVERYSHVMHISSDVYGKLAPGFTAFDAMRAGLPVGTVSGAPKIRAMEIIDELEPTRRGPYAGAVGYIDFAGNMDTCIALRTIVMRGEIADVQAGAGVVYDSSPEAEYQETVAKARGMLRAIDLAESIAGRG